MQSTSICQQCSNAFQPRPGTKGIYCSSACTKIGISIRNKTVAKHQRLIKMQLYNQSPSVCGQCTIALGYKQRKNKFCSSSCAATFNNTGQVKSAATKFKIAKKSAAQYNRDLNRSEESYQIRYCLHCNAALSSGRQKYCNQDCVRQLKLSCRKASICVVCNKQFQSAGSNKRCPSHRHMVVLGNRAPYEFKFNVFDYPNLFDIELLKTKGFKSCANPNGLVRDHKVSIFEARKEGYDPYYISHVMNCQLLTANANSKKSKSSSLSYEVLQKLVDDFDKHHQNQTHLALFS